MSKIFRDQLQNNNLILEYLQSITPAQNLSEDSIIIFKSLLERIKTKSLDQYLDTVDQVEDKHVDIKFTFKDKELNESVNEIYDEVVEFKRDVP